MFAVGMIVSSCSKGRGIVDFELTGSARDCGASLGELRSSTILQGKGLELQ